jgi:membrane protein implicated in regulation of membrane protease activity
MVVVYIVALIVGLLLGVAIMLFGIERPSTAGAATPSQGGAREFLPLIAGFAVAFGVAGYSLLKFFAPRGAALGALVIGIVAAGLVRWLVAKSASMSVEHDIDDERYVLQGHVARVIASIVPGNEGRISFEVGKEHRTLRARSLDDASVEVGTEVVIERIEGDLAYVESWLQVEQRL